MKVLKGLRKGIDMVLSTACFVIFAFMVCLGTYRQPLPATVGYAVLRHTAFVRFSVKRYQPCHNTTGSVRYNQKKCLGYCPHTRISNLDTSTLAYYVAGNVLEPIGRDYLYSELVNPVFTADGDNVKVKVAVKFIDNQTKATQVSQFELVLHKDSNWKIVG